MNKEGAPRKPWSSVSAARPISVPAGFSAAFVPGRSLPPFCFPARALVRVRVLSPVLFRSWAEPHFLFQSWAGLLSGVSQIDAGGRCPHSPGPAEQTSQGAAVAPVVCAAVPVVAASGRALVARCSDFPGPAQQISHRVVAVARLFSAVDPPVAAVGRVRVARRSDFPGLAEQISHRVVVVVLVFSAADLSVAAVGRARVARRSDFPGPAEQLSQRAAVVAAAFCEVDPSVAAPGRARVVRTAPAAVFRRKRAAQGAPP